MRTKRDGGLALVLVMTVVLALAIIATPFVLSMLLQEKQGTAARYDSQAWYGAHGAKNFATWRLMYGVDPVERRASTPNDPRYLYDALLEQEVLLTDATLQGVNVLNPRGPIWGIDVQDEQGKLNVTTAPPRALGRIREFVLGGNGNPPNGGVVNLRDYLTQYSGRDATWIYPQRIRGIGSFQLPSGQTVPGIAVDSAFHFGPQSRVLAVKPGAPPFEARVTTNYLLGGGANAIEVAPALPTTYTDGAIYVEARHPVNPNTARRETLAAVFDGVSLVSVPGSTVDAGSALTLAQILAGRTTRRLEDFLIQLAQTGLSPAQKVAVAINAVDPACVALGGSGTVPLCFRSYDVYTLEALSSMNNPAGAQVAGRGFREVVSVSPPAELTRFVQSQWDLDSSLAAAMAVSGFLSQLGQKPEIMSGYPFGNRWITFPNLFLPPGATADPSQPVGPSDTALGAPPTTYAQPGPARDYRGEQRFQNQLEPWNHFDNTLEGKKLNGAALTYSWDRILARAGQRPDPVAGGLEMWVRFDQIANPLQIFDLREQDYRNRLSLRVENSDLILTICDGTMGDGYNPPPPVATLPPQTLVNELYKVDNGAVEVRAPLNPLEQTWYHLGAYWKGTRHGQAGLLADGFAYPKQDPRFAFRHVDPKGNPMITELGAGMSNTSTTISLRDDSWLPNAPVALLIGDEVVVYDKGGGTLLRGQRVRNPGQGKPHPAGATVQLFGYSSRIQSGSVTFGANSPNAVTVNYNRIPLVSGQVKYNFGQNPTATVAGDKQNPMTMMWYIDSSQTDIPVNSGGVGGAGIMEFPDQGYILINQEVIFYTGRSTGGIMGRGDSKFTGCQRPQQGTTAAQHNEGARIEMWGIPVTTNTGYCPPNQGTVIQIGDEWFGPVQPDSARQDFFIPYTTLLASGAPRRLPRAALWSAQTPHAAADKVVPTFLARETDLDVNRYNLGPLDLVTLVDASGNPEQQIVRRAVRDNPPGIQFSVNDGQLAAFYDWVSRDFVADNLHARILKFPSGELPGRHYLETQNPPFTIGPMASTIDELKFLGEPKGNVVLLQPISSSEQKLIELVAVGGAAQQEGNRLPLSGGAFKLGDEIIGYGTLEQQDPQPNVRLYRITANIHRGWLNTTAQAHASGESVMVLPYLPVSTLAVDVAPGDKDLRLNQPLVGVVQNGVRMYTEGYVLLNNELVGFEWDGGGLTLGMPAAQDGTGLFRGRFGTSAAAHKADATLVYGIPWRFWDTYKPLEFDNRMCYYQWSTKMDLARWGTVTWVQEIPAQDPNITVHGLVRLDGRGEFWDPPGATDKSLIFENASGASSIRLDRVGHLQDAGQFDVRFYVEYRRAFDAVQPWNFHSWKRAPKIRDIRVTYDRPTRTLYHEDH